LSQRKEEILFFEKILPAYNYKTYEMFYNNMNIVSCHSKPSVQSSYNSAQGDIRYKHYCLKGFYYGKIMFQNIFKVMITSKPKVVMVELSMCYMTMWILLLLKSICKYKLIIHTHGIKNDQLYTYKTKLHFILCKFVYNRADAVLFYNSERKIKVSKYISNANKLFIAYNTLYTPYHKSIYEYLSGIGKDQIKSELGITTKYVLIYVGRLIQEKNISDIVKIFIWLKDNIDISLHIIGSGPEKIEVEKYCDKFDRMQYHGPIYDDEKLSKYLYVSDMFINPGTTGLSIIHSFCYGVPYLTYLPDDEGPFHGPEYEYLKDNYNGLAVKKDNYENINLLIKMFNNKEMLAAMSLNALNTAYGQYNYERMENGYRQAIKYVMNNVS